MKAPNYESIDFDRLSKQEKKIVGLNAEGLSLKEIANSLGLSPHTVNNHMRTIKLKTGLSKTVEISRLFFHKVCNVDYNLTEIKRRVGALVFLAIISPSIIDPDIPEFNRRSRTTHSKRFSTKIKD